MASASSGLRHPASASCLGRHLRLAGRCPNNSSLFPPLAAVVVVASHVQRNYYFYFAFGATAFAERSAAMKAPVGLLSGRAVCVSRWRGFAPTSSAERSKRYFHGRGRNGKRQLLRLLPRGEQAQRLRGYGWRSEKSVKAIAPTGAALAFLCFDFFFRIVKGV